ncbi:MAG: sulfite exporter TauE/SafE family protein [Deltaproteobacteria bacterium]|nr:sulfite exporter TauE/SafE family protein [Deltaproteobacteria bacterium]
MKKYLFSIILLSLSLIFSEVNSGFCRTVAAISSSEYNAGDVVTIEGTIDSGKDLFIAISSQKTFAPKDTKGVHETKRFKKDSKKKGFTKETSIPDLYYMLTTNPEKFGKITKKKFGGPSFFTQKGKRGLYETTMFKLLKFDALDAEAKASLATIKTEQEWNFYKYAHESSYGINTVVKESTNVGKVTIFARSVLGNYNTSKNYWDKGTSISLDKTTGKFKASFKSFRHTPPDSKFDVYVNGNKSGSYNVKANGFWLNLGGRYMHPIWIIIGAILVGTYFSMIGAAGGMLMAAFQVMVVQTAGPVGINAANVLRPSNMALTLFSPLGSFYRYAVKERRVAWPVGISFGVGIFLGSIWLGQYVTKYLPMKTYKEWLAILVVIMGIRTLYELTPKVMEKRKSIKMMVKKFNEAVAKAKAEGTSVEMGRIEPVKTGLTNYRFKFWGETFNINPLLFGLLGLGIGIVSRSFGIGGGFLLVPAMTTLGALPMYVAVPISLIGTCFSSIGSFIGYLLNDYYPDMWLMISIIIGGFVGGMLGSRVQKLFSEKTLKIVLAITLFFLFFRFFKIEIWI